MGLRNFQSFLMHALYMKSDGMSHIPFYLFLIGPRSYTTRQIRRKCRIASFSFLNYDQIFHFSPACLSTLFNVPGASSSLCFPANVTSPFLALCLYWRWLPLVLTMNQPSFSIILATSLSFTCSIIPQSNHINKKLVAPGDLPWGQRRKLILRRAGGILGCFGKEQ